ncbi:sodium:solute symporter family protein [Suipraeoptans intestinalis]|uniref:sodium:solute symporter family protein n=1 Tax=Suipraeoptans intestinalis TaxID=2606628 RepID=UPI0023F53A73|nr:sodium:solute symporter [Suipraeoptans intestinalis]MDD7770510.1 sodium:solute symporter [Suipraeoptans intestinalis]MDY3122281.1 sodium:solute symporter [Suipraeoptans intestinalis]
MEIKIIMLVLFFASMTVVGVYARKHSSSVDGFVLGGRKAGPWLTAFAYGTSYFSAVVFVGYAGQFGWKYGLSSTWIGIGNALIGSLLAWVILGRRTRVMSQHLKTRTMPEFFEKRYGNKGLKLAASAIVFCFLIPYTASIYNGLSRLFGMAFHIPYTYCVVAMAVFTGVYVILGGYMATAINDLIQGIIMLAGIVAVILAVLKGQGGFLEAVKQLSELSSDIPVTLGQKGAFASFFGPDPVNLAGVVVLTSLGTWGLPQMVGKFYAIKDEKSINTGTVISTLFAVVVAGGCYFLGGFGRLFDGPEIRSKTGEVIFDSVIPHMLSSLPDVLIGIVVVLVLSASMSTLASLVLTSSSTLTLDFLKESIWKEMSEKKQVLTMQICIVLFIGISVVFALHPPAFIAQMMGISWGALAGAFLAPFLYGLYWKRVTVQGVWAGFLSGVGFTVGNLFVPVIPSPINAGAFAMILGLVLVPAVSLLTKKPEKSQVDAIFSCYEETVVITKKRSLEP